MKPDPLTLTPTSRALLVAVYRHGPRVTIARLAEESGLLNLFQVYKNLDRLQSDGWLVRTGYRKTRELTVLAPPPALNSSEIGRALAPTARTRDCLQCHGPFKSKGAHHRICSACKGRESWQTGGDYSVGRLDGRAVAR